MNCGKTNIVTGRPCELLAGHTGNHESNCVSWSQKPTAAQVLIASLKGQRR